MEEFASRGLRPVAVAKTSTDDLEKWDMLGLISLFDPPRHDTEEVIEGALRMGAAVKMITGDHLLIAKETCRRLGMGDNILGADVLTDNTPEVLQDLVEKCDGFAEVFPEHKFEIVALYQKNGHITGMTGDGVNDAPALRKANVGFAVEDATPAAQGASSVILLTPGLSVILTAIQRSRKIFQRLENYIIYRIFLSIFLLTFFFVAIVIARMDFPSTLILAYDKVIPNEKPDKWKLKRIIIIGTVLGLVAVIGGLIALSFLQTDSFGLGTANQGVSTLEESIGCKPFFDVLENQCKKGDDEKAIDYTVRTPNGPLLCKGLPKENPFACHFPHCYIPSAFFIRNGLCKDLPIWDEQNPEVIEAIYTFDNNCQYKQGTSAMSDNGGCKAVPRKEDVSGCSASQKLTQRTCTGYDMSAPQWGGGNEAEESFLAGRFPYSHAVENGVMFMVLCLIAQFAIFSARVRGPAWERRPGYLLVGVVLSEAAGVTLVGALMEKYPFWDTTVPSQEEHMMLTTVSGAYIGFAWLHAALTLVVMELAKVALLAFFHANDQKDIEKEKEIEL
eukprot:UC4_evm1s1259